MTVTSPAAEALLELRAGEARRRDARIPVRPEPASTPLSAVQRMVWLSAQLDKSASVYNRCSAMRVVGSLDREALQRALTEIIRRHAVLRSRVVSVDGEPELRPFRIDLLPVPVIDLSVVAPQNRAERVRELLDEEARLPFDLDSGPFIRAGILREDDNTQTLYISTHHIASDGWSDGVMFRELDALYGAFADGKGNPLLEPTTKYSDFVVWQRDRIEGPHGKGNAEYWRARMDGAPAVQELPGDRPRPVVADTSGGQVTITISSDIVNSIEALARQEGATPAITMLAAFTLLQSRITSQADTVVGLSLAGRTHPDVEPLIGLFNCVMPVRVTVDRDITFRDLLRDVRAASLEAQDHQETSVEAILESLTSARGVRHPEIAHTVFNFRNMPPFDPSLPGLDVQLVETFNGSAVAELELEVIERKQDWECALRFRYDLFDEATAARLLGHYATLLQSIVLCADYKCGKLSLLSEAQRQQLLVDFCGPVRPFDQAFAIDELIGAQAAKTPAAIAVQGDEGVLTYQDLELRSNAMAHDLIAHGAAPGNRVGICMERSIGMVVSLLAILKSGAAIVPLDADYPVERLAHMVHDTDPALVLVDSAGVSLLGEHRAKLFVVDSCPAESAEQPKVAREDDAVACVLYTSGSTGLPKGVLSTHRGIVNNLRAMQELFCLSADDCMLQQTSLGFDAAAWELFWPLAVGARVHLARAGGQRDAEYVIEVINDKRIATVGFAPSMLKVMLDMPDFTSSAHVKRVMSYGEVLSPQLQDLLFARMPNVELFNLYGPTETSVAVTAWNCERNSRRRTVPIGRPLPNTEIFILDPGLEPVPIGVGGEVFIGGVCVSNGYHDRPDLTAQRFLPHPFRASSRDRVYRTGDIARFGPDGIVEYVGRRDHQLKIRGVRVELEEIEAALESLPAVSESVVIATTDSAGDHHLTAYVAAGAGALSPTEMRRALEKRLPPQFLPAQIIALAELPHGPNGKVDRTRLPEQRNRASAPLRLSDSPQTEIEQRLASIWKDLLNLEGVGVDDSFFDIGGHSLLAVRMLQRFADATGESVSLRSFYADPTIRAIARIVSSKQPTEINDDLPPVLKVRESKDGLPPFFYFNGQPRGGGKYARRFVQYLPGEQGFYLVPIPIFTDRFTVEGLASRFVTLIRAEQPQGPYQIGGNCFGATLAFEVASQLKNAGEEVALLALVHPDARAPMHLGFRAMRRLVLLAGLDETVSFAEFAGPINYVMRTLKEVWRNQRHSSPRELRDRLAAAGNWLSGLFAKHARRPLTLLSEWRSRMPREADELIQNDMRRDLQSFPFCGAIDQRAQEEIAAHARHMSDAWTAYNPKPYSGPVAIIWPVEGPANPPWRPEAVWKKLTPRLTWFFVPGNHWTMLNGHFEHSARALANAVTAARKN